MKQSPFDKFSEQVDELVEKAKESNDPVQIQSAQILAEYRDAHAELAEQAAQSLRSKQAAERLSRKYSS